MSTPLSADDIFTSPLSRPVPRGAIAAFKKDATKLDPVVDPAVSHALHDVGQARRLADRFGDRFRFDFTRRVWWKFNGQYFELDRDAAVKRCAIDLARELYLESGDEVNLRTRELLAKFSIQQQSRRKIDDVLELAKSLPPIADAGDRWNEAPLLLATPYGVVDLARGGGRDGCVDDRINLHANAKFNPFATCPRWQRFLLEVFVQPELIAYVQRAVGYSATADMREQVLFIAHGGGANGKSTFIEVIAHVLGDYAYSCAFSTFEATQGSSIGADVAALAGRRFVFSCETTSRSRFNEARLKALSGGDRQNARHLYGNPFEFSPVCKLWLGVNHKPAVSDDSFGFWRRVHLIPFTETFTGSSDDKNLKETLRGESAGILNWIVQGARAWLRDGLAPPDVVLAARDAYRAENDPLADFLDESCESDAGWRCAAADLYAGYLSWCERQGVGRERLSRKRFGSLLGQRFEGRHTAGGKVYVGIRLRRLTDVPSVG